jgi:hypothetical protein
MITVMLILIVGTVLLGVSVGSAYNKRVESHHLDVMAGDEGDD